MYDLFFNVVFSFELVVLKCFHVVQPNANSIHIKRQNIINSVF